VGETRQARSWAGSRTPGSERKQSRGVASPHCCFDGPARGPSGCSRAGCGRLSKRITLVCPVLLRLAKHQRGSASPGSMASDLWIAGSKQQPRTDAGTSGCRPIRKPRVAKRANCRLPRCPPRGILDRLRPRRSQQALRASGTSLGPSGAEVSSGRRVGESDVVNLASARATRERYRSQIGERRRDQNLRRAEFVRTGGPRLASAFGRQHQRRAFARCGRSSNQPRRAVYRDASLRSGNPAPCPTMLRLGQLSNIPAGWPVIVTTYQRWGTRFVSDAVA
jgi:hypothetical protein